MSNVRQSDVMVHNGDLGQLASGSRYGSNINHYDSMETAVTDSGELYETLERHRNTTGCCSSQQSQRSDTNTGPNTYTRYIRPCGQFRNLNDSNNCLTKTSKERSLVQLRTIQKGSVRYKCRTRNVIFSFIGGLVLGVIISSVCWLTVDKLKENKIVCELSEKANDENEEKDVNETKTSSIQSTQTTSRSNLTASDIEDKDATFRSSSSFKKVTDLSNSTAFSISMSTPSLLNVSQTGISHTSQTSDNHTLNSKVMSTHKTPVASTDPTNIIIHQDKQISTSRTSPNVEAMATDFSTTLPTNKTKPATQTSQIPILQISTTIPITPTDRTKTALPTTENETERFSSTSPNVTDKNTHRPTSPTVAHATSKLTSGDEAAFLTSTILNTIFSHQTTVYPKELSSSNSNSGDYSGNISLPASSTETYSSTNNSSTTERSFVPLSSPESNPLSSVTATPAAATGPAGQSSTTGPTDKSSVSFGSQSSTVTITAASEPVGESSSSSPEVIDKRSLQGGHVYIRWGSFSCPVQAELMYKGYTAGGHWQHQGGATNTICLPEVPTWGNYSDNRDEDRNLVYGTEYGSTDASFLATTGKKLRNKDVPCSVCQATGRLSHIMIPGKTECFRGWTKEYRGYLMGSGYIQNHASELICVDSSPDHVTGSDMVKGGNFLYLAEVRTGSLPSPSYVNGRELSCVVCTV